MDPGQPNAARRQATVLESVEEIRAFVRGGASKTVVERPGVPTSAGPETQPFRPTVRPPMGLLTVLDDGDDAGEAVRVRAGSFVIGRVDGDLVIPHDNGMSGRHAEISRRVEGGVVRWFLKDLQSTNGTFARASTVVLHHEQELLVGGRRFRFEAPSPAAAPEPGPAANATRAWQSPGRPAAAGSSPPPTLVELTQGAEARRVPLVGAEYWLGRDSRVCSIVVDDPMVDPRHARVYRDDKAGRWVVANEHSRNGLWARVQEVSLGRGGSFQCGEQRFLFKAL